MRQTRNMLLIAAVLTLGLVSFGNAQMMMGNSGSQMKAVQNDTLSHSATMMNGNKNMMNRTDSLVTNMSKYCQMMSSDFDKLQTHFEKMMQMNDMKALKTEMAKHRDMMNNMQGDINGQNNMCQNMMSMMHSGGTNGMMGMNTNDSNMEHHQNH